MLSMKAPKLQLRAAVFFCFSSLFAVQSNAALVEYTVQGELSVEAGYSDDFSLDGALFTYSMVVDSSQTANYSFLGNNRHNSEFIGNYVRLEVTNRPDNQADVFDLSVSTAELTNVFRGSWLTAANYNRFREETDDFILMNGLVNGSIDGLPGVSVGPMRIDFLNRTTETDPGPFPVTGYATLPTTWDPSWVTNNGERGNNWWGRQETSPGVFENTPYQTLNLQYSVAAVVPVPPAIWLMGSALALIFSRRSKKAH